MKGWNLCWWEQGHEDPPGYLRMGRSGPGIAGRRPHSVFQVFPLTPYPSLLTVFFDLN